MKYDLTKPCDKCPFRSDIRPYLNEERAYEIGEADSFACHKTTESCDDEDDSDRQATAKSQMCAGYLILREKMEQPSQSMRIAERLGLYDRTKLDMNASVFDDISEMAD